MEHGDWHIWIVVVGAMLVPVIYGLRVHKMLLLDGGPAAVTRFLFVASAVLGIGVALLNRNRQSLGLAVALLSPLVHSAAFRKVFRWFVRTYGREPADVHANWSPGLVPDRAFAILFFLVCTLGTMAAWGAISWAPLSRCSVATPVALKIPTISRKRGESVLLETRHRWLRHPSGHRFLPGIS